MMTKSMVACVLAVAGLALGQKVKSKAEGEAVTAVLQAQAPDQKIAAADALLAKYKDTEFKSIALEQAGEAYEQKGDSVNAIIYGQRSIDADAKNFSALLLVSRQLAQSTRENDLDKDEKVKRTTKLANDAIAALNAAPKPNVQLADDQWAAIKKDMIAQAHDTLGVIATVDKKYDAAIKEYSTSLEMGATPDPVTMVRLASAYNSAGKFDEAAAAAEKALASNAPDSIKKFAQSEKQRAEKGKAGKK